MTAILNLAGWHVLSLAETGNDYHIEVEYIQNPRVCPLCGATDPKARKFGTKKQIFMDLPIHAKRVGLNVKRQRYECLECGSKFYERYSDMDEAHMMTNRLVAYIRKRSLTHTFTSIANDVGVHERTVRRIFKNHVADLDKSVHYETPLWMGIDELKLAGQYRCIICNIQQRSIIDLLPKRTQKQVAKWLSNRSDRSKVEVVAMDMWNPYRIVVRDLMPNAVIVIDKFHVVRMANESLDTVRKGLRDRLSQKERRTLKRDRFILLQRESKLNAKDKLLLSVWKSNFPELAEAHKAKEDFYAIWDSSLSSTQAKSEYSNWEETLPSSLNAAFKPLITAFSNWNNEIFHYFDYPATNAYTEALNGVIKLANRNGRGYSFDAIRAKILYSAGGLYERERPLYDRRYVRDSGSGSIYGAPFVSVTNKFRSTRYDE